MKKNNGNGKQKGENREDNYKIINKKRNISLFKVPEVLGRNIRKGKYLLEERIQPTLVC